MTDRDVIERVAGLWGCSVTNRYQSPSNPIKSRKPMYQAAISGSKAVQWGATIYAFMGARRKAAIRRMIERWKEVAVQPKYRTHCPKGHAYAGHNLTWARSKKKPPARKCRVCQYAAQDSWRARHPENFRITQAKYAAKRYGRADGRQLCLAS